MLFKSLFCFQGADQGARFALISVTAYLGFILSHLLFWRAPLLLLLLLATFFITLTAASLRRVNDAELPKAVSAIPVCIYAIIVAIILYSDSGGRYFLLLLGAMTTLAFVLPPAKSPARYVLGYHGPKATVVKSMPLTSRIEPTLVDGQDEHASMAQSAAARQPEEHVIEAQADPLEPVRVWYQNNQKLAQGIAAGVSLLAVILAIIPSLEFGQSSPEVAKEPPAPIKPVKIRDYALEMPGDYYLMLDQNDGLVIHWRTSDEDNPALWSLLTAKGDNTCKELVFNDKERFRTTFVAVENGGDYFAELSPLDTHAAIKAIADKRDFSLCGYDFSLKGSRATIDGSETYYVFLQ